MRLLVLVALYGAITALACTPRTQAPISGTASSFDGAHWDELPVSYCIVPQPEGFVSTARFTELVHQAFDAWGKETRYTGECRLPILTPDFRNEIGWGSVPSPDNPTIHNSGVTYIIYRPCNLCVRQNTLINEADITIELNPTTASGRNEDCLYSVILHETGHFLGLQHSEKLDTVMGPWRSGCPQEPTAADRAALDANYK